MTGLTKMFERSVQERIPSIKREAMLSMLSSEAVRGLSLGELVEQAKNDDEFWELLQALPLDDFVQAVRRKGQTKGSADLAARVEGCMKSGELLTAKQIEERAGVSLSAVRGALKELASAGRVRDSGERRNRRYEKVSS